MGRRNSDDVFVLGDELIATETTALRNPDSALRVGDQEPQGAAPSGLGHRTAPAGARGPRRFAALGLGAAAAAALGVLELTSGSAKQPQPTETSSRSALVLPPAPGRASPPAPTDPPSSRPEPSHGDLAAAGRRSQTPESEHQREPTPSQAPEISPLSISTPPAVSQTPAPAPLPPIPPPPSGGGGPEGTEQFGFER